jgi:hypothetical protein
MPDSAYPLRMLQTISRHLYTDRGFKGNTEVRVCEHALTAGGAAVLCGHGGAGADADADAACHPPPLVSQQPMPSSL